MKNYPEYPDNDDVQIKELAVGTNTDDFNRAKKIVDLCRDLRQWAIQNRPFVRRAVKFYLSSELRGLDL